MDRALLQLQERSDDRTIPVPVTERVAQENVLPPVVAGVEEI